MFTYTRKGTSMKYIILIAVDIIAVIGIIAVFMSVKRRRAHRSLRNPAPPRWGWSLAAGKPPTAGTANPSPHTDPKPEPSGAPVCSLCGAPMVLRTSQNGQYAGKPFLGCSAYPKCENTTQHISLRDTKIMRSILK
jgi:hypothetical protein